MKIRGSIIAQVGPGVTFKNGSVTLLVLTDQEMEELYREFSSNHRGLIESVQRVKTALDDGSITTAEAVADLAAITDLATEMR